MSDLSYWWTDDRAWFCIKRGYHTISITREELLNMIPGEKGIARVYDLPKWPKQEPRELKPEQD